MAGIHGPIGDDAFISSYNPSERLRAGGLSPADGVPSGVRQSRRRAAIHRRAACRDTQRAATAKPARAAVLRDASRLTRRMPRSGRTRV